MTFRNCVPPSCVASLLVLALLSLFLLVFLHILKTKKKKTIKINLPPSPPKLPIIGNLHQLSKLPHQNLYQLSQKYGPVMLLQLGYTPTLVISSAEMAKEILQTHDIDFCSRPISPAVKKFFYNFSGVAFSPYTDHWRERRKIFVSHLLNSKRIQSFWKAREAEINHLIESISVVCEKTVNLDEKMFDLVDGVITTVAFGKSYRGKQFEGQILKDVLDETMDVISCFSGEDFLPPFIGRMIDRFTGQRRKFDDCFSKVDGYLQKVMDDHLLRTKPKDDHEDFVDVLIKVSEDQNVHLNNNHIKAMLMNTFLGGVNSAAIAIVWAMSELIKNPRIMKKVQTEIRRCIGRKPKVDLDDLGNLKYLKMVVKETMKLHAPAPLLIPHECTRQCRIGSGSNGYDIQPGARVLINVWALGRDPKSWENPNEFFPERFEEKRSNIDFRGRHFELLPFGAGRRFCPGANLASDTIEFTLANLLYCFDWQVPRGMKIEDVSLDEESGITSHKRTPLYLVPFKHPMDELGFISNYALADRIN